MDRTETISRLNDARGRLHEVGVDALYLFGSFARDEGRTESDVDVFVDPDYARFGYVELIRAEALLRERLGRPVDLTTRDGLHPVLREGIEREAIRVF